MLLLFCFCWMLYNTQQKKNLSCTSQPCYWLPPTFKNVPFARICDIDFTSAQRKHRNVLSSSPEDPSDVTSFAASTTITPSSSEIDTFYHNLSKVGKKPVILSLVPGFCDAYVPLQSQANFPTLLMNLYKEDYLGLSYPDLLTKCKQTFHTLMLTLKQWKRNRLNLKCGSLKEQGGSQHPGLRLQQELV